MRAAFSTTVYALMFAVAGWALAQAPPEPPGPTEEVEAPVVYCDDLPAIEWHPDEPIPDPLPSNCEAKPGSPGEPPEYVGPPPSGAYLPFFGPFPDAPASPAPTPQPEQLPPSLSALLPPGFRVTTPGVGCDPDENIVDNGAELLGRFAEIDIPGYGTWRPVICQKIGGGK